MLAVVSTTKTPPENVPNDDEFRTKTNYNFTLFKYQTIWSQTNLKCLIEIDT